MNGPEASAAVMLATRPAPSVRGGRRSSAGRILLAADETSLAALEAVLEALPDSARGQVFVEVASADDVIALRVPELVSVAWLAREDRSGNPGTARRCAHGQALERAVTAWVSEMVTGDPAHDGGELTAWIGGSGTRVHELREQLVERLGESRSAGESRSDSERLAH